MMNTVAQSRIDFGLYLKALRQRQHLTLRGLDELSGATYSAISCIEHGDRAIGADVATRLATALNLEGDEREAFLMQAASTRRKDRLIGYARTLAPELVNFVPRVLSRAGIDLEQIDGKRCTDHILSAGVECG